MAARCAVGNRTFIFKLGLATMKVNMLTNYEFKV